MRLLVMGYKNFELGIFSEKDLRLKLIKQVIRKHLLAYMEQGLSWLIFTGDLGFEYWVLEEALQLRKTYDLQLACIFPFETHGQNWSEVNQEKLARYQQLDFVKYAYLRYENPSQFRDYHQFLIDHTDGAYLFYDREHETKLKFIYRKLQETPNYDIKTLAFDELNEEAENF